MTVVSVSPGIQPLQTAPPLQSGRYYFAPNIGSAATSSGLGIGNIRLVPWYVPNSVTLTRIGAEVTAAGDAGSKFRLGIYGDDGAGRPGALILDAGTIAGDSVAVQEIVISQALAPGNYWVGGAVQVVAVTQPTMRTMSNSGQVGVDGGTAIPTAGATYGSQGIGGIVGAFPASLGAVSPGGPGAPRVFVKVA